MVSFLCTIWLLSVEETRKSQSRRETGFIIVMKMESLEGRAVKSFHVPFSESGCQLSTAGRRDNPSRRRLVTCFRSQLFESSSN